MTKIINFLDFLQKNENGKIVVNGSASTRPLSIKEEQLAQLIDFSQKLKEMQERKENQTTIPVLEGLTSENNSEFSTNTEEPKEQSTESAQIENNVNLENSEVSTLQSQENVDIVDTNEPEEEAAKDTELTSESSDNIIEFPTNSEESKEQSAESVQTENNVNLENSEVGALQSQENVDIVDTNEPIEEAAKDTELTSESSDNIIKFPTNSEDSKEQSAESSDELVVPHSVDVATQVINELNDHQNLSGELPDNQNDVSQGSALGNNIESALNADDVIVDVNESQNIQGELPSSTGSENDVEVKDIATVSENIDENSSELSILKNNIIDYIEKLKEKEDELNRKEKELNEREANIKANEERIKIAIERNQQVVADNMVSIQDYQPDQGQSRTLSA